MNHELLMRWRLLLGEAGAAILQGSPSAEQRERELVLSWLYERDAPSESTESTESTERSADLQSSQLTVPEWISSVHRLFPKETIELLERDAVETYKLHEVVTNPDCLRRLEPSETLLRAVLQTKHLMNPEVLAMARALTQQVVQQLLHRLARVLRTALYGARAYRRTQHKSARNFDARGTIRRNLDTWDAQRQRLAIRRPLFLSRQRRQLRRWQIILLVDESGSMLDSVIHSAVLAACLWGLPGCKTHLCIFDTEVVDLTEQVTDPVEVLMRVQLGGGTDIGRAVSYAAQLVEQPGRTILVLLSDFYEGADPAALVRRLRELISAGVRVVGLVALDRNANPSYNHELAQELADAGAHVGAMTPAELVSFLVDKVKA